MGKFCVYEHIFPNGKKYIGITSTNPEKRWRGGEGYKTQGKIWNAIKKYGWEKVRHNIIADGLTEQQAICIEQYLIAELDTINNGYNTAIGGNNINTSYLNENVMFMIRESKRYDKKYGYEQNPDDIVSFAEKGKTNSYIADIINTADQKVQERYCEYRKYSGAGLLEDFGEARVDCYWWTLKIIVLGHEDILQKDERPYRKYWSDYYCNLRRA